MRIMGRLPSAVAARLIVWRVTEYGTYQEAGFEGWLGEITGWHRNFL
jgi:hypothetical protein